MTLILYTRKECCLCEEMDAIVRAVAADVGAQLTACDVDTDGEWRARYGDEVPVLFVNGRKAFKYRLTRAALQRRLAAERRRQTGRGWRTLLGSVR